MMFLSSPLLLLLTVPVSASVTKQFVTLPPGTTPLSEIGIYSVGYQSYGGEPVHMPPSWVGHFDQASGISYLPNQWVLGRAAFLLHSPWHVPAGKTWIDYPLRLPQGQPVTLRFAIAMRQDIAVPGKSDGATFGCYVINHDGERELLREHYARGEWKDFQFDLTSYGGQDIILRLQVEPGPANSPSWDYSYFGGATIQVGTADRPTALAEDLLHSQALKATTGVSFAGLANDPAAGVVPSNLLESTNAIASRDTGFEFVYEGSDCRVVYRYTPETGTLDDFTVHVDDKAAFRPALGGGVTGVLRKGERDEFVPLHGGKAETVELGPGDKTLHVVWEYPLADGTVQVDWRFGIRGKALTVETTCANPVLSGMSLGHEGEVPLRKPFTVPYLLGTVNFLPVQQVFCSRYLDWTVSHASACPQGEATYESKTDGSRNPLRESGYIAVSPNVAEVLPNLPHPPSPYLEVLGPRIMLDVWQHHDGTYEGDAQNLRDLKDNGVDHLAIISHVWQRYGYDVKLPDHMPANPQFGGDAGMKEFGKAANECGYIWSLHENYIDLYPDAPSYDPDARVLRADGTPSPAWFNAGTGVQSFGLKCNRALDFARANSPDIHAHYGTNAAYLDVHTCVPPWHQLDHDATQPMAAVALFKVQRDTELFQYERNTHGGPLFGEGNNHFFWAGRFDGAEAQVSGGEDHAPFLDFDLLKLHPQMVNHGMGYYERWFRRGYDHQWGYDTGTVEQVDKYRAQEIAYGHAGFIGAAQTDNVQWVAKEHHLMHPIQRLMNTATPTSILYEVDGTSAPASVALVADQRVRQQVTYDSGLKVWVNWGEKSWTVEGRTLPQWGFLALGPDTEVATVLQNGRFADYATCPEFLFIDARTSFNMPYLHRIKDITPRLESFEWLGGNQVRLTYAWDVNETLDKDYRCFVHFTSPLVSTADSIAFQQDHGLPKPTSQWKPGETIIDGPYDITIPDEPLTEYNITLGLFDGQRLPLRGVEVSRNRILIGKLRVDRAGGAVTGVRLGDMSAEAAAANQGKADFASHLNPAGTWVDFGTIATDGSVKINKGADELVVFPYPQGKTFTVTLDLTGIVEGVPTSLKGIRITALARQTQEELGDMAYEVRDGRLVFETKEPKAGRYRIRW